MNIYWPIYKNLENEVVKLSYDIHIDDNQINVYSSKIIDLILRSAIEIESLSKELYYLNGGTKKNIKFDEDALKYLSKNWTLNKKIVIISYHNCFQSNRVIIPFLKETVKYSKGITYVWNNAYQNLKHERNNNIHHGSVGNLFNILGALYILNVYYREEQFLLKGNKDDNIPLNLGSDLFSFITHKWSSYRGNEYVKKDNFDECIYITKYTDKFRAEFHDLWTKEEKKMCDFLRNHKVIKEYFVNLGTSFYFDQTLFIKLLGENPYWDIWRSVFYDSIRLEHETEAVLNKNQV